MRMHVAYAYGSIHMASRGVDTSSRVREDERRDDRAASSEMWCDVPEHIRTYH